MKQTIEQRRLHHQTREDRQRKVYGQLQQRIADIKAGRAKAGTYPFKLSNYERDAARLAAKLRIESLPPAA